MNDTKQLLHLVAALIREHDPELCFALLLFRDDGTQMQTNVSEEEAIGRCMECCISHAAGDVTLMERVEIPEKS